VKLAGLRISLVLSVIHSNGISSASLISVRSRTTVR
jgi:hypothetical protein